MKRRKILILSHNPINDEDNMGKTMRNIFSCFSNDELCQLYIRNQKPKFSSCLNYFYIDESSIIKSIFNRKIKTGKEIVKNDGNNKNQGISKTIKTIYNLGRKRNQLIYILRNILWKKGNWYSFELKKWLDIQKPTAIFLMAGDYSFLFDIAMSLSKTLNIPLFTYYVDEFYFTKRKLQIIPIEGIFFQKRFKTLYNFSNMNFCISESMCQIYHSEFNKGNELLMNSIRLNENVIHKDILSKERVQMTYMGNISYDRWKNLSILSTYIKLMNSKYDKQIEFTIYSSESKRKLLNKLIVNEDVKFGGCLNSKEVEEKIKNSDILVHVEAFDKKNVEKVKYSISTKIPDLLNSGKLVLAFGPKEVESINYLLRNEVALVTTDENNLKSDLEKIYFNKINIEQLTKNAEELLIRNHINKRNKEKLEKYL